MIAPRIMARAIAAATMLAAFAPLAGCNKAADAPNAAATPSAETPSAETLAAAIAGDKQLGKLAAALRETGLANVLDGAGAYTIIAPRDAAFAADPAKVAAIMEPANRAALVALLRAHIVPGYLTPEDIGKAIDAAPGKPVTMRTMGDGVLTFTRSGSRIDVTASGGAHAALGAPALRASNGVAIPVDGLLRTL